MSPPRLLGAVLAGGEGRRFGGPKADAGLGGKSMVRRAVEALAPVVEDVVILSSRPVADTAAPVIPDAAPGAGPLGGLVAALDEAEARGLDGVLLLACDMPLVETGMLARLSAAAEAAGAAAAAPERDGGGLEATCAVYRVSVADVARTRLASGDRSLHGLFRDVEGAILPLASLRADANSFLNVNTPADRERAEAALEPGPGDPA